MNYRKSEDLSPEFQVRLLMYELNSLLRELPFISVKLNLYYNIDNLLTIMSILVGSLKDYKPFNFDKYINNPRILIITYKKYAFETYNEFVILARAKGLWGMEQKIEDI